MRTASMKTLAAATAGAGLAYLLDPDRGRARRAKLRDKTRATMRREREALERRAHYERGRLEGVRHKVADRHHPHEPETDQVLVDKVRSEVLGRRPDVAHQLSIDACRGVVTIRGEVDETAAMTSLSDSITRLPGVERVIDLTHAPGEMAPNKADARRVGV